MTKEELKMLADGAESTASAEKPAAAGRGIDRTKEIWVDAECPTGLYVELNLKASTNDRGYFGASKNAFDEGDATEYNFSLSEAVAGRYKDKSPKQLIALVRLGTLKVQRLMVIETGELKSPNSYVIGVNGSIAKSNSTAEPV